MQRVQHTTASATLPTPTFSGTVGYYSNGNPGIGVSPTWLTADNLNQLQEELANTIVASGQSLNNSNLNQLTSAIPTLARAGRKGVAQVVMTETGAVATGSTTVPQDDTIPQITEGNEYMTATITPTNASSTLLIEVIANVSSTVANTMAVCLFQDATANALAVGAVTTPGASYYANIKVNHTMTAGTTSATTFRVRIGSTAAGTTTFNGAAGARIFGGAFASSIKITEILPTGS